MCNFPAELITQRKAQFVRGHMYRSGVITLSRDANKRVWLSVAIDGPEKTGEFYPVDYGKCHSKDVTTIKHVLETERMLIHRAEIALQLRFESGIRIVIAMNGDYARIRSKETTEI